MQGSSTQIEDSFFKKLFDFRESAEELKFIVEEMKTYVKDNKISLSYNESGFSTASLQDPNDDSTNLPVEQSSYILETLSTILKAQNDPLLIYLKEYFIDDDKAEFVQKKFLQEFIVCLQTQLNTLATDKIIDPTKVTDYSSETTETTEETSSLQTSIKKSILDINNEHIACRILDKKQFTEKDLSELPYQCSWDFESLKSDSENLFHNFNINRELEQNQVIFTGLVNAARIRNISHNQVGSLFGNMAIYPIDITERTLGPQRDMFSYRANVENVLSALNIVHNLRQPAYFIVNDEHHWAAVVIIPTAKGLNIYQFDSMVSWQNTPEHSPNDASKDSNKGKEKVIDEVKEGQESDKPNRKYKNLTIDFVSQLEAFLPKITTDAGVQLIKIDKTRDLSIYVQSGNNCGLASGLFVSCIHALFEEHAEKSAKPSEDLPTYIIDNFKARYTQWCLRENEGSQDSGKVASLIHQYTYPLEDRLNFNQIRLTYFLGFPVDLTGTRYSLTKEMQAYMQICSNPEYNQVPKPTTWKFTSNDFVLNNLLGLLGRTVLRVFEYISAETSLFIQCSFSDQIFETTKAKFNEFSEQEKMRTEKRPKQNLEERKS